MEYDQGLDNRFVLFIDFLGASEAAQHWPADRVQEFVNVLTWLAHCPPAEEARRAGSDDNAIRVIPEITTFADRAVVSYDEGYGARRPLWAEAVCRDAVRILSIVTDAALSLGVLLRGGMAFGQCHHDVGVVFGAALVEAQSLEAQQANMPRVLLDHRIVEMLGTEPERFGFIVQQDSDRQWVLNHYDHMIRHGVSAGPSAAESAEVWKKTHLETIDRAIANLREAGDDEAQGRIAQWEWFRARFQAVTLESLNNIAPVSLRAS
jgi:hypothetical protein